MNWQHQQLSRFFWSKAKSRFPPLASQIFLASWKTIADANLLILPLCLFSLFFNEVQAGGYDAIKSERDKGYCSYDEYLTWLSPGIMIPMKLPINLFVYLKFIACGAVSVGLLLSRPIILLPLFWVVSECAYFLRAYVPSFSFLSPSPLPPCLFPSSLFFLIVHRRTHVQRASKNSMLIWTIRTHTYIRYRETDIFAVWASSTSWA